MALLLTLAIGMALILILAIGLPCITQGESGAGSSRDQRSKSQPPVHSLNQRVAKLTWPSSSLATRSWSVVDIPKNNYRAQSRRPRLAALPPHRP